MSERIKVSDYVAQFLKAKGVKYVFGLQGGAVVHLFDSIDKTPGIQTVFPHHEQCAALAAVSYGRVSENIGAVIVTTGPGSTNALTGLLAAWQDSIPCIFISGQTRKEHTSYGKKVRQVGTQELNIVDIVKPITKYAKFISSAPEIEDELERAYQISIAGRPGPVWIDLPVNIQWEKFEPRRGVPAAPAPRAKAPARDFSDVADMLRGASKPLVYAGHGIRSAKAAGRFGDFVARTGIPFVTTWTAADLVPTAHPLNTGIVGLTGQRGANKAVHAADVLLVLGSHLAIPQTSTLFDQFAPQARKIVVNIDKDQLENLNMKVDLAVAADVNSFFEWCADRPLKTAMGKPWLDECKVFKKMNSVESGLKAQKARTSRGMNSYVFNDLMTRALPAGVCIVVDGGGTALYTGFQSSTIKKNQRIVCSATMSSMGTGLAESIGACFANRKRLTSCIIGDGSFLMNVQDLQPIFHHRLPIKIFIMNNSGYLAIRHTQTTFLGKRYVGCDAEGGLTFPSIRKVAGAFRIPYFRVAAESAAKATIGKVLKSPGPAICEVIVPADQEMLFKQGYRRNNDGTFAPMSLAEMWPYTETQAG